MVKANISRILFVEGISIQEIQTGHKTNTQNFNFLFF